MATVRITRTNRITLPREVRQALGLKPGDYVEFEPLGGRMVEIKKMPQGRRANPRA